MSCFSLLPLIVAKSLLPWKMVIPHPPPTCTPSTLSPITGSIILRLLCHPPAYAVASCQVIIDALIACKSCSGLLTRQGNEIFHAGQRWETHLVGGTREGRGECQRHRIFVSSWNKVSGGCDILSSLGGLVLILCGTVSYRTIQKTILLVFQFT